MCTTIRPFLFCLFLIPLFSLHAQSPSEAGTIRLRLVALSLTEQIQGVGLLVNDEFEELIIPSTHFPDPVEYSGANPLTLYTLVHDPETNEKMPIPVARATLPEGAEEVLFLMLPLPPRNEGRDEDREGGPPARYGIKLVDFSPESFPETSFLLWNVTGRPLVGMVGEEEFQAPNNQFTLLQPDIGEGPRALDAKIVYADDPDHESYTSRKWFIAPGEKQMMMIIPDRDNSNSYLIKVIRY